ncbi:MAG: allantoate deiminase [Gudongella sp.]|nr:allantoate deiminase [Gudongella sp.]
MGIEDLDIKDITKLIDELSRFGGSEYNGVTRLLFDDNWIAAQNWLEHKFKESGLDPYYDEVGNLYGRFTGDNTNKTILTGSHVDTVVSGGKLDGQYGIIAGLVAIEYLQKKFGKPKKNLEVVSMAEEEGSRFPFTFWGSKNIVSRVEESDVDDLIDEEGILFLDAMKKAGFGLKTKPDRKDIEAFIELHVEQGGVLEIEKKAIGIVEHIVGQQRFTISLCGEANHAGTTPMNYRRDSLHAASKMISEIMDRAIEYGDPLVATVGKLDVNPNTSNVVPGRTIFTMDIRHTDAKIMSNYIEETMEAIKLIAAKMKININIEKYMDGEPVPMDKVLVEIIKNKCTEKNIDFKMMHSGAGHDSQMMASKFPTGLIFVPSKNGISHNPQEYTKPEELLEGVKALIEILYTLAY